MKLNEMKLEVIRFHEEDVIATSTPWDAAFLHLGNIKSVDSSWGIQGTNYIYQNGAWVESTGPREKITWNDQVFKDLYYANDQDFTKIRNYINGNNLWFYKNESGVWSICPDAHNGN